MLSSERVLGGRGVSAGGPPVRDHAASSAGSSPAATPATGAVLRGSRRQGGAAGRPGATVGLGRGPNGHTMPHVPEPASPEAADLRRLHGLAEERGFSAGRARAERDLAEAVAAAGALAARLEADAPSERAVLARWVTDLSLAIARRILGDAIRSDAAALLSVVERAILAADASPDVRILVHPRAVVRVREAWEATHGPVYLGKRWTFGGDPTLPPTGCLVRYQHGVVDAGIDAELDAVDAALKAAIEADERADVAEAIG